MKESLQPAERTGKEPIPTLKEVDKEGLMTIRWDKKMRQPENLNLLKEKEYAVFGTDATAVRRRQLVRRREWFDTNEQFLQYLLIIEALEIEIVAEKEDGEDWYVPFSWDIASFGDFDFLIKLYYLQEDI